MALVVSDSNMSNYPENKLIQLVKEDNNIAFEELAVRYLSIILAKASTYRCIRTDLDDFIQEGLLALLYSAKAYDSTSTASFATFASGNINRRFLSLCKKETRQKDFPKGQLVSINDADNYLQSVSSGINPEETVINEEAYSSLKERVLKRLSPMEHKVFSYYVSGLSYEEISTKLGVSFKAVDNALQRIRKKLR